MFKPEEIEKIRGKFPDESVQVKKSFKDEKTGKDTFLTGYKPQYIIERLNDCFGHEGWDFEILEWGKEQLGGKGSFHTWVRGQLTIYLPSYEKDGINGKLKRDVVTVKQQFGTSKWTAYMELGDALKGAATNSMEKCASLLDIGHQAYKGLLPPPGEEPESTEVTLKSTLSSKCKEHSIGKAAFETLTKNVLKEEKPIKELTDEDMQKLIDHLEKNGSPF